MTRYRVTVNIAFSGQEVVEVTASSEERAKHIAVNEVVGDAQVAEIEVIEE